MSTLTQLFNNTVHKIKELFERAYNAFTTLHPIMRGYWYGIGTYLTVTTFSKAYGLFYGIIVLVAVSVILGLFYANKRYLEITQ